MIDTDKYEGHTEGPWEWWNDYIRNTSENELYIAKMEYDYTSANAQLMADAPLLLEEVKRLQEALKEAVIVVKEMENMAYADAHNPTILNHALEFIGNVTELIE